jgi:rare lipoprotein A (peptidoglycan hydrolase)
MLPALAGALALLCAPSYAGAETYHAGRTVLASWYGPGLYGNHLACGGRLSTRTVGVAHRWLPCGTPLTVCYHGRCARALVVDRGPFVYGRELDLTGALAWRLGFGGVGRVFCSRC